MFRLLFWLLPTLVATASLAAGLGRVRRWDSGQGWLGLYLLGAILNTLGMEWMGMAWHSNVILILVFLPFQILMFTMAYGAWRSGGMRIFFRCVGVGYGLVWAWRFPHLDLRTFSSPFILAEVALFMVLGLIALVAQSLKPVPILRTPTFWTGSGAVLDGCFTLLFFLGIDWALATARSWVIGMMVVRACLVSLTYVLYARALRCPLPTDCS